MLSECCVCVCMHTGCVDSLLLFCSLKGFGSQYCWLLFLLFREEQRRTRRTRRTWSRSSPVFTDSPPPRLLQCLLVATHGNWVSQSQAKLQGISEQRWSPEIEYSGPPKTGPRTYQPLPQLWENSPSVLWEFLWAKHDDVLWEHPTPQKCGCSREGHSHCCVMKTPWQRCPRGSGPLCGLGKVFFSIMVHLKQSEWNCECNSLMIFQKSLTCLCWP